MPFTPRKWREGNLRGCLLVLSQSRRLRNAIDSRRACRQQRAVRNHRPPGGQILGLNLGREEFHIRVLKVREIMGVQAHHGGTQKPAHINGVINLIGKAIPVVDLRPKANLPEAEYTRRTCIVVVQVDRERIPC